MVNSPPDLLVVGSGVAGAMVALTAIQRGQTVLMLEAGSRFDFGRRLEQIKSEQVLGTPLWDWARAGRDVHTDDSEPVLGYRYTLNDSRVRGVGGSTLHWGGLVQRFWEGDFESRSRYGLGADWPIGYDDIEPWYARAEQVLGVAGTPNPVGPSRSTPFPMPGFGRAAGEDRWEEIVRGLGGTLDLTAHARNSSAYDGRSPCVSYAVCNACPSGARFSADFQITALERTGRLDLRTETVARRVELNSAGVVVGVHASTLDGRDEVFTGRQVIIAAHAVETARLLLLSDVGNGSDQVGRHLMEHWYAAATARIPDRVPPPVVGFGTSECSLWYDDDERGDRGAIKLEFALPHDVLGRGLAEGHLGVDLAEYDEREFGRWATVAAELEHQPNPESRVTLDPELTDMFGDPAPKTSWRLGDVDRKTHARGHELLATLLEARGGTNLRKVANYARAHHHMGTCRMSHDPAEGVVDANCRVHGAQNLYLAGSSVFPTGGARQPTLTIAALALRLGEYVTSR
jgi:choline dehydrogenase-like flavoprotein